MAKWVRKDPMAKFIGDLDLPKVQKPTNPPWLSYIAIAVVVGFIIWGILSR